MDGHGLPTAHFPLQYQSHAHISKDEDQVASWWEVGGRVREKNAQDIGEGGGGGELPSLPRCGGAEFSGRAFKTVRTSLRIDGTPALHYPWCTRCSSGV